MIPNIIKTFLGMVLGFKAGSTASNTTAGVLNYAAFVPVFIWVWSQKANAISLQMVIEYHGKLETVPVFSTTFGGLGFIIAGVFVYLEFLRRSVPGIRLDPPVIPPS